LQTVLEFYTILKNIIKILLNAKKQCLTK